MFRKLLRDRLFLSSSLVQGYISAEDLGQSPNSFGNGFYIGIELEFEDMQNFGRYTFLSTKWYIAIFHLLVFFFIFLIYYYASPYRFC